MEVTGSLGQIRTINAAYTVQQDDRVILITSGVYAITLPTVASARGRWLSFYNLNGAGDDTTISASGSEKIVETTGLAASVVLTTAGDHLQIFCDGTYWYKISKAATP